MNRRGGLPPDFVDLVRQLHPEARVDSEGVTTSTRSLEAPTAPGLTFRVRCGESLNRVLAMVGRALPGASLRIRRSR